MICDGPALTVVFMSIESRFFLLTHVVGDSGVNEVSDKLHDAAVGVSVVQ